jgi:hypothetical protein
LPVEESALNRYQPGEEGADDGKNHDTNQQLDERETATGAAKI